MARSRLNARTLQHALARAKTIARNGDDGFVIWYRGYYHAVTGTLLRASRASMVAHDNDFTLVKKCSRR